MLGFKKDKNFFYLVVILVVGFLVYFNSFQNNFVWDDEEQVVNNLLIRSGDNLLTFFKSSTFYYGGSNLSGGFYRPLVTFSYFLNYSFWGLNPLGYHLYQIFFHLMNLVLIFLIIQKILKNQNNKNSEDISFISTLLFAVHSVNVEAVAYIGSIGEILYSFFALFAFYLFLKGINNKEKRIERKSFFLVFFLIFLSFLSKESGFLVIPLLFLYLFLFVKPNKKTYFKFLSGSTVIFLIYSFLRFFIANVSASKVHRAPISSASLWERLATIPYTFFSYLKIIFFPKDLFISRHFLISSFLDIRFWLPFIVFSLLISYVLYLLIKKKTNTSLFFFLWFLGCLFPTLNIIPLDMTMAERWLYFPLIGLIPFLVLMVFKLKIQKRKIFIFFITISLVFGLRTFARNKNWKDGLTLYGHDIEYSQNSFDLENNYGVELFREGKISEAQKHFEKSISLQPNWKISRNNLGAIYQNQGKLEKAKEQYYKSIEIGDYKLAYENLASILLSQEKNKEALDLLEKGVLIFNQSDKIKKLLVIAYYRVGKIENSMNLLSQIIKESPDDQEANYLFWVIKNKKDIKF